LSNNNNKEKDVLLQQLPALHFTLPRNEKLIWYPCCVRLATCPAERLSGWVHSGKNRVRIVKYFSLISIFEAENISKKILNYYLI